MALLLTPYFCCGLLQDLTIARPPLQCATAQRRDQVDVAGKFICMGMLSAVTCMHRSDSGGQVSGRAYPRLSSTVTVCSQVQSSWLCTRCSKPFAQVTPPVCVLMA